MSLSYTLPMIRDSRWGNPETKSYAKAHIREAKQGAERVNVHAAIRPMVEQLLGDIDAAGFDIGGARAGDDAGLVVVLPKLDVTPGFEESVYKIASALGFDWDNGSFSFAADYAWAEKKSGELAHSALAEVAAPHAPAPVSGAKPGSRELKLKDKGTDVMVLQYFFSTPPTGTFDVATRNAVQEYQQRNGLETSGVADREFWAYLLPKRIMWRRMGEAGRDVRLVQAALVTFGYQALPMTNRMGVVMNRAIHTLRVERQFGGQTKIDQLVWDALFDMQWRMGA